jgi:sulfatase maturation enzyme AslB (radical SAM superfamily)
MFWPRYHGSVELICNDRVAGWVWDARSPGTRLGVAVHLCGNEIAESSARLHRPDLGDAGIGDGAHAFDIQLEKRISDQELGSIAVNVKGTRYQLPISADAINIRPLRDFQLNVYSVAAALSHEPAKFEAIRLDLNNDCNLRCVYCHNHRSSDLMSLDDFRLFIDNKVIETKHFQVGCIMEPTLDNRLGDFLLMIGASRARPQKDFTLQTNGILLHRHDYAKMRDSGLTNLQVSLDSAEPKVLGSLRSGMSLQRVTRNVAEFHQKCPDVGLTFVCTITKENISLVEPMITAGLDLGVRDFVFREVFYVPTSDIVDHKRMPSLILAPGEFVKMRANVVNKFYGKANFDFASEETLNLSVVKMRKDSNFG